MVGTAPLVSESPTARTLKTHLSCGGHTAQVSAPEVTLQMLNNTRVTAVGIPSCRMLLIDCWKNPFQLRLDMMLYTTIAQQVCGLATTKAP